MRIAADICLATAVLTAWFGTFAFIRLRTPQERIHAVAFVNITTIAAITLAGFISQGATSQTLKCVFILVANMVIGALLSHAMGRAIHLRGGIRR